MEEPFENSSWGSLSILNSWFFIALILGLSIL